MRICRFISRGADRLGCIVGNGDGMLLDVTDAVDGSDILALIGDRALLEATAGYVAENGSDGGRLIDVTNVMLLPPIGRPGKIVCLAGNYGEHIVESGYVEPGSRAKFTQQLFLKPSTSLLGHNGVIGLGKNNHRVGWETELAVVIGKRGKDVKANDAFDHIFGYTILNDISE